VVEQIGVSFAEGVVDFGHDRVSCPVVSGQKPEAHWLEGITQHTRVAEESDAAGCSQSGFANNSEKPVAESNTRSDTVVAGVHAEETASIDRDQRDTRNPKKHRAMRGAIAACRRTRLHNRFG
jgi:hypothetical protein